MRSLGADPSLAGLALDPSKCSKLSMEEKRYIVYELSEWTQGAPELLQSWSRRDLLEILCLEMGKERKYTGLTKYRIIEILLKIVSEKNSWKSIKDMDTASPPPPNPPPPSKRQRKNAHPCRLPVGTIHLLESKVNDDVNEPKYCQNLACRAPMSLKDDFCKRCSCCICYKYDDNKDPSLWLGCGSEVSSQDDSCGMSCHLECALKHEKAGIARSEYAARLDGSFYCVSCGKVNDLLGCWKKQLCIAKDARRVDILCYRVSLSHKLLSGTDKFQNLLEIVELAVKKLEAEVGVLDGLPTKLARGIVNRLSSGAEIQKLCATAITLLDSMLSTASDLLPSFKNQKSGINSITISFENISATSLTVIVGLKEDEPFSDEVVAYTLWYRKADMADYLTEPICKLVIPEKTFLVVSDLEPATVYTFKVVASNNSSNLGEWEARVTTERIVKDDPTNLGMNGGTPNMNCESPESNGSGLSNHSEGYESNNAAACTDQEKLLRTSSGCAEKPDIPDLEKAFHSEDACNNAINKRNDDGKEEELPDRSVAAAEEPTFMILTESNKNSQNSTNLSKASDVPNSEKEPYAANGNEMVVIPYGHEETMPPFTPSKLETFKGVGRSGNSKPRTSEQNCFPKLEKRPEKELLLSSLKKRSGVRCEELCNKGGSLEEDYEYCVKVVRWLECEGHVETNFRVKFLTWFSMRATPQERRVVSVFVDTLIDDPHSLAGQLIDTFSEGVHSKPPLPLPTGFCTKLWH